ncbi:MAG: ATP-binding protein, partial [Dethiobacteria bacterium]
FVVFDLQGVEQYPDVMQIIFIYLTDIIRRRIMEEKQKQKILVFDEAWSLLNSEESANFLGELYRTMRKFDCAVWAITQDISDIEGSYVSNAIMTNTYRYIVLRQINERAIQAIERVLNLNEVEKSVVSLLEQKKGYYSEIFLKQMGIGASRATVVPSPMEYWMATTDPADNREMGEALKKHNLEEALKILAENYPHGVMN